MALGNAIKTSSSAPPATGDFIVVRGKFWIVEKTEQIGPVETLRLVSCEDDSQGEVLEIAVAAELETRIVDSDDWSALPLSGFEGPQRLGAYIRATKWRSATAADRKLFQAPFRAGIRLDSYQLLPLAKALDLPRVNLLIADDVGLGKTVEAGLIARELLLRRRIEMIVVAAPLRCFCNGRMSWRKNSASISPSWIASIFCKHVGLAVSPPIPGASARVSLFPTACSRTTPI